MEVNSVEAIVRSLNNAGVRYLIAGGLAVVAHGHPRFTADIDLIVDLEETNLKKTVDVFKSLEYVPRAPVRLEQFADASARQEWIRDKRLKVFSLFSSLHAQTEVDLFVESPLDFATAYQRAARLSVAPDLLAPFVSLEDLLYLKKQAGRPTDLEDIRNLTQTRNPPDEP